MKRLSSRWVASPVRMLELCDQLVPLEWRFSNCSTKHYGKLVHRIKWLPFNLYHIWHLLYNLHLKIASPYLRLGASGHWVHSIWGWLCFAGHHCPCSLAWLQPLKLPRGCTFSSLVFRPQSTSCIVVPRMACRHIGVQNGEAHACWPVFQHRASSSVLRRTSFQTLKLLKEMIIMQFCASRSVVLERNSRGEIPALGA